jgi:hypothetical protein
LKIGDETYLDGGHDNMAADSGHVTTTCEQKQTPSAFGFQGVVA